MVIQYSSINKIRFPVYELPSGNWNRQDGLLFLDGQIVDDKNQAGDTLGLRRMQTPHKNLLPLKNQVDTFRGIVKSGQSILLILMALLLFMKKQNYL